MIIADEDALICDFAQYYHIYDYKSLPVKYAAILACGLGEESRIRKKIADSNITLDTALFAIMADRLSYLVWMQTKDGQKNRNRPKPILETLEAKPKEESQNASFNTGNDFEKAWEKITGEKRKEGDDKWQN